MIYIVDYIGVHCGMHYYLEAFKRVLESIEGTNVGIVSNYSDNDKPPILLNHYKGSKLRKGFSLINNLIRLNKFVNRHKHDKFIYLTYGNSLDPLFMNIICKGQHHCIDIHEAVAQCADSNMGLKSKLAHLYKYKVKNVIYHSARTEDFLNEYGYTGDRYYVPHFKYIFPKDYDDTNLSSDIKDAIAKDKINLLFFGNITNEKGIDILLEAMNLLPDDDAKRYNVIVAGKDFDGAYKRVELKSGRNIHFFLRHISDEELRFLYSNVDFLTLPYRKTSQSGILEMAFYFKRPIIASDIPYFHKMLTEFPSFGRLAGNGAKDYANALQQLGNSKKYDFFKDEDYARYENRKEINEFKNHFKKWLKE